jgi:protein tyrosine/serine phosphatase
MPAWVLEGVLATSPRPGYSPGPEHRVPAGVVDAWLEDARAFGIASVICLLDEDQLWLYRKSVPGGLIARYRQAGLEVAHIPTLDQQTNPFNSDQYEAAWDAFRSLPHPVLVHCSAGHDRTGRIVSHILERLSGGNGASE